MDCKQKEINTLVSDGLVFSTDWLDCVSWFDVMKIEPDLFSFSFFLLFWSFWSFWFIWLSWSFWVLQWCALENQQSPVHVVNCHFTRHPYRCCHKSNLLAHLYYIWELSIEVLYDPVPQRGIKNTSRSWNLNFN